MGEVLPFPHHRTPDGRGKEGGVGAPQSLAPTDAANLTIAAITGDAPMPPHMARVLKGEEAIVIPIREHGIGETEARCDGCHIRRTPCAPTKTWREGVCDSGSTVAFHFLNLLGSLGDLWRALWDIPSCHDITIGERTPGPKR